MDERLDRVRALFVRDDRGHSPDGLDRLVSDNPATRHAIIKPIAEFAESEINRTLDALAEDVDKLGFNRGRWRKDVLALIKAARPKDGS